MLQTMVTQCLETQRTSRLQVQVFTTKDSYPELGTVVLILRYSVNESDAGEGHTMP